MIAFSIWSINVYRYWIFYVISFLAAYLFFIFLAKKKVFLKYTKIHLLLDKYIDDLILYSVLWVIVWWRVWQILIYDFSYYFNHPIEIFQFWKWWMSFIGWMLWVVIAMTIFANKNKLKKIELLRVLDLILIITPFGIMLGRIWNFLNQELYGIVVPYNFRWLSNWFINIFQKLHIFHVYDKIDEFLRINTNFIASFFEWFLLLIVTLITLNIFLKKWFYKIWYITWIFLVWYSVVRFFLEYLRMDSQSEIIFYLSKSQWFFVCFFILWLFFLLRKSKKISIR